MVWRGGKLRDGDLHTYTLIGFYRISQSLGKHPDTETGRRMIPVGPRRLSSLRPRMWLPDIQFSSRHD
jgi:hypothetical protein